MQLGELRVPIAAIRTLPRDRQNLLLTLANAKSELGIVVRVTQVARNQKRKGSVFDHYHNAQFITMLKIMAGKIHECWALLRSRYYRTGLSTHYTDMLGKEAREQLDILKKYFGRGNNVIELVRNEAAFHYGGGDVSAVLADMADEDAIFYIADSSVNDLPYIGLDATTFHLLGHVDAHDPVRGLAVLADEVAEMAGRIIFVLREILTAIIAE